MWSKWLRKFRWFWSWLKWTTKTVVKLESFSMTSKLSFPKFLEINRIDFDESNERNRVADFLYNEYSLEEIIYQLSKTMFSQSLIHGSEQSQRALQNLTGFLETEGENGKISKTLQKKILGKWTIPFNIFHWFFNIFFECRCFAVRTIGHSSREPRIAD